VQLLRKELDANNVGDLHERLRAKLKQKIEELFPDRPSPVEDYEPIPLPGEPVLCQEQQDAMDLALRGHNLFITGSGGCGKSVLIKALHMNFRARGKKVHLVAPTGLAALNIGGHTTFNYAGWTPNDLKRPFEKLEKKSRGDRIYKRFRDTDVIIIDEISMVENQFFDRLSLAVSSVRCSIEERAGRPRPEGPFGGVQVIAVGDFCQLPPVEPFKYCLECGNDMKDKLSKEDVVLRSCPKGHGDFEVQDKWAFKSSEWEKCKFTWDDFRFPDKNGISNKGEPEKEEREKEEREKEEREKEEREKEGSEKEGLEKNVPNKNESKKPHVDLARKLCNGSQGVVCGFEKLPPEDSPKAPQWESYIEDPDGYRVAKERYRLLKHYIDSKESPSQFPVVQFDNGQRRVIGPDAMVSESGEKSPYCLLSRTQIPLAPGWAMTIHKSQSLSLDRVIVNLARAFEKGQAYVALSRARSPEGLKIEGTSEKQLKEAMKLNPTVKKFMEEIDALMAARAGTSIQSSKN
ncbi:putative PIF1, partial [Colletotrichum sublineola]